MLLDVLSTAEEGKKYLVPENQFVLSSIARANTVFAEHCHNIETNMGIPSFLVELKVSHVLLTQIATILLTSSEKYKSIISINDCVAEQSCLKNLDVCL